MIFLKKIVLFVPFGIFIYFMSGKKKKRNESGKILSKIAGKKPSRKKKKKKKSTHRRLRPHGKEKERALQTV